MRTGPSLLLALGAAACAFVDLEDVPATPQGNLFVGVRNRFLEETESRPSAAFQLQTKIPTASERERLGSGALDFLGAGIVTKDLGGFLTTGFSFFTTLGLAYEIAKDAVADTGVVVGVSDDAPDFQIVAGVTINFGHLFPGARGAAREASALAR